MGRWPGAGVEGARRRPQGCSSLWPRRLSPEVPRYSGVSSAVLPGVPDHPDPHRAVHFHRGPDLCRGPGVRGERGGAWAAAPPGSGRTGVPQGARANTVGEQSSTAEGGLPPHNAPSGEPGRSTRMEPVGSNSWDWGESRILGVPAPGPGPAPFSGLDGQSRQEGPRPLGAPGGARCAGGGCRGEGTARCRE